MTSAQSHATSTPWYRQLRFTIVIITVISWLLTLLIVGLTGKDGLTVSNLVASTVIFLFLTLIAEIVFNIHDKADEATRVNEIITINQAVLSRVADAMPILVNAEPTLLERLAIIATSYGEIQSKYPSDGPFAKLCRNRIHSRLLRPSIWEDMQRGHIYYDNPEEELPIAGELISGATELIDAITKTAQDLHYLQSPEGVASLARQRSLASDELPKVTIRRLFVCNPDGRYVIVPSESGTEAQAQPQKRDVYTDILCVAKQHQDAKIVVRILIAQDGASYAAIPDMNIIDGQVIRVAEPLEDDGQSYMTANVYDMNSLTDYLKREYDYQRYWNKGQTISSVESQLGISCPGDCALCQAKAASVNVTRE